MAIIEWGLWEGMAERARTHGIGLGGEDRRLVKETHPNVGTDAKRITLTWPH